MHAFRTKLLLIGFLYFGIRPMFPLPAADSYCIFY